MPTTITPERSTLSSLPSELLWDIAERIPQGTRFALCWTCRRLRQEFEPLLYQDVTIRNVAAAVGFQQTVTQDKERAKWVRALSFDYTDEEDRGDTPADMEVLPYLPNLESLSLNTPYHDKKAWEDVWKRALAGDPSERILSNLKSCFLLFQRDNREFWFWGSNVTLDLLELPSLENLTLAKWKGDCIRRKVKGGTKSPSPLKTLIFAECDIRANGLEEFLKVRSTEALSVTELDESCHPLEEDMHDLNDYVQALEVRSDSLKSLQWLRCWDRWYQTDAAKLGNMHALRTLYIDPHHLFGTSYGKAREYQQWLRSTLPPNLETILFDLYNAFFEELSNELVDALQANERILPKLQRIEFLAVGEERHLEVFPELFEALKAANVQWGFYEEHYDARWAMYTAKNYDLAVQVTLGELEPWESSGNVSLVQRFYPRHGVNIESRAFMFDDEGVRIELPNLLMDDLPLS